MQSANCLIGGVNIGGKTAIISKATNILAALVILGSDNPMAPASYRVLVKNTHAAECEKMGGTMTMKITVRKKYPKDFGTFEVCAAMVSSSGCSP